MSLEDGVAGIALYIELKSAEVASFVTQFIVIPKAVAPDGSVIPQHIRTRALSEKRPQPAWRRSDASKGIGADDNEKAMRRFTQQSDVKNAVELGLEQLRTTIGTMDPVLFSEYTLVGEPLLVEFSDQDAQDMADNATPRGLIGRINRLRDAREFPALPGKAA